jgi:hypothetical protein
MRKIQLGLFAATISACATLSLMGCSDTHKPRLKNDEDVYSKDGSDSKMPGASGKTKQPIKVTETGVIKGVVKLEGDKPDLAKLTKEFQTGFDKSGDKGYCLMGSPNETSEQNIRIGDNNQVGNVFVWIEPENSKEYYFEIADDVVAKLPKLVEVQQPHCAFLPHCSVVFSRRFVGGKMGPTGQQLRVINNASVSHNTKIAGGQRNAEKNQTLAGKKEGMKEGEHLDYDPVPENDPITIACSIHPWMRGYVRAFTHPYATVSHTPDDTKDAKYGSFEIKDVPVGASVRIYAWHEKAGFLGAEKEKGKTIKLEKETKVDFAMPAK